MPYIEIKTRKVIDAVVAKRIIRKGNVSAIVTTGKITNPAKVLFDQHGIAFAENIPEEVFIHKSGIEEE